MATGIPDMIPLFETICKWDGTVCVQLKLHTVNFINSVLNSSSTRCHQMFPISHRNRSCISWCHVQRAQQHVWFFVLFSAHTSFHKHFHKHTQQVGGCGNKMVPWSQNIVMLAKPRLIEPPFFPWHKCIWCRLAVHVHIWGPQMVFFFPTSSCGAHLLWIMLDYCIENVGSTQLLSQGKGMVAHNAFNEALYP